MKNSFTTPAAPTLLRVRPDGSDELWNAMELRLRDASRRFVAGEMPLQAWNAEVHRLRAVLGLEAR